MKEAMKTTVYVSDGGYLCIKQHDAFNEYSLVSLTIEQITQIKENFDELIDEMKANEVSTNAELDEKNDGL